MHDNKQASKAKYSEWINSKQKKLNQSMKRLSLLIKRKLQNSPSSIYKYSFITFRHEVIDIQVNNDPKLTCLQYVIFQP